jgi:hypothetical protein
VDLPASRHHVPIETVSDLQRLQTAQRSHRANNAPVSPVQGQRAHGQGLPRWTTQNATPMSMEAIKALLMAIAIKLILILILNNTLSTFSRELTCPSNLFVTSPTRKHSPTVFHKPQLCIPHGGLANPLLRTLRQNRRAYLCAWKTSSELSFVP